MVSTSQYTTCAAPGPEWRWVAWSVRVGAGARARPSGYWVRSTADKLTAILAPAPPRSTAGS